MNAIQQFEAKVSGIFPEAKITEREVFIHGGMWLTISLNAKTAIIHWFPDYGDRFGLTDFSNPDDDRHIFESRPDEMFENEAAMLEGLKKIFLPN